MTTLKRGASIQKRFISGNEAHTEETEIIQEYRESVKSTENTQTHLHN